MKPQIISGRFDVTENLDCIEFIENGFISIPNTLKELTINKLINSKEEDSPIKFEILVTGEDGEDGHYGSGEAGKPGQDGATVKITVLDLVGDVHIKAGGGMGGAGGKGAEGHDGGNGGSGGDGGNGANVEFYYSSQAPDSTSYAYAVSAEGGMGGKGGSGGSCTGSFGKGGAAEQAGTAGGKFGDGGSGGKNGKNGTITIHHPDGGCSINGIEQSSEADHGLSSDSPTGARILDLGNPRDYRRLIQSYGGENHLKKYPLIWAAVKKTKEFAAKDTDFRNAVAPVKINGSITQITPIGVDSNLCRVENGEDIHNYYQFKTSIFSSFANTPTSLADKFSVDEPLVPIAYMIRAEIKEKDTGTIIYNTTLYNDEGDATRSIDNILTDVFPYEKLLGKRYCMTGIITYEFADGSITSAELQKRDFEFDGKPLESYIKQITITAPHWHEKKTSGDIMFLYGRTTSSSSLYVDADYWDKDGPYFKNNFNNGILRTIIPMSGTITLNNPAGFEVTGVSIDSYTTGKGKYPVSCLDYNISGSRKTIATHRADKGAGSLGEAMQENHDVTYDKETNSAIFDLKLPPATAGKSDYDWECNLSGGFLDDSSHKCYLNGCLILNVAHKLRVGSTNDRYSIFIYSTDALPKTQEKYYISTEGATIVYIPAIVIYWGCYARETLVKAADGSEKRVDEIRPGDKLRAFGNKTLTVADILTGSEVEIFKINTADGNHIRVSGGHRMKLWDERYPEGRQIAARYLKKGDLLMTPEGSQTVKEVLIEDYDDLVYNFIFKEEIEPNYIEANGYWSGDFYAQNEMTEEKVIQRSDGSRALADELRRFAMDNQK